MVSLTVGQSPVEKPERVRQGTRRSRRGAGKGSHQAGAPHQAPLYHWYVSSTLIFM